MVLDLRAVTFAYPRTPALRGVSLTARRAEVVAVTGPSGSGKSTLLHVAAGLLRPDSGSVTVCGQDMIALDDDAASALRRREIGLVLQHGQLVPELPVVDNVALPLLLDGTGREAARAAATGWLDRLGVADVASAHPADLSGGQAQRVAVARALVTGASVVLADEPTGSMDSDGGEQVLRLMVETCRSTRSALVVVTHDNKVAAVADREVRLLDGVVQHEAVLR
ncbi:MAG: ABC transporter ATP-binding protein [Actinomycetales bacterium]|nr:ABC transporter ATP-binding protein [Actinomycetales bacterium]